MVTKEYAFRCQRSQVIAIAERNGVDNMGKQKKKEQQGYKKTSKWDRVCERCGNETFSRKPIFKCQYCNLVNGTGRAW